MMTTTTKKKKNKKETELNSHSQRSLAHKQRAHTNSGKKYREKKDEEKYSAAGFSFYSNKNGLILFTNAREHAKRKYTLSGEKTPAHFFPGIIFLRST